VAKGQAAAPRDSAGAFSRVGTLLAGPGRVPGLLLTAPQDRSVERAVTVASGTVVETTRRAGLPFLREGVRLREQGRLCGRTLLASRVTAGSDARAPLRLPLASSAS